MKKTEILWKKTQYKLIELKKDPIRNLVKGIGIVGGMWLFIITGFYKLVLMIITLGIFYVITKKAEKKGYIR